MTRHNRWWCYFWDCNVTNTNKRLVDRGRQECFFKLKKFACWSSACEAEHPIAPCVTLLVWLPGGNSLGVSQVPQDSTSCTARVLSVLKHWAKNQPTCSENALGYEMFNPILHTRSSTACPNHQLTETNQCSLFHWLAHWATSNCNGSLTAFAGGCDIPEESFFCQQNVWLWGQPNGIGLSIISEYIKWLILPSMQNALFKKYEHSQKRER